MQPVVCFCVGIVVNVAGLARSSGHQEGSISSDSFAFGDLGWASMLRWTWAIFRQILTSRLIDLRPKCLVAELKGPYVACFQRFEIQTTIIWCDHLLCLCPKQQFLAKVR